MRTPSVIQPWYHELPRQRVAITPAHLLAQRVAEQVEQIAACEALMRALPSIDDHGAETFAEILDGAHALSGWRTLIDE